MRTAAQIQASRINGAKSRGPITAQGKKNSSMNALKHGLTARTVVLCNEDHSLFEQLQQNYIDALQPTTAFELDLIQHMAVDQWRIRRAWAIETAITDADMIENRHKDETENPELDQDLRLGLTHKRVAKDLNSVHLSEARFARSYDRALTQFLRLRKLRPPDLSTTGRNASDYLKWQNEPSPVPAAAPETTSHQRFATAGASSAWDGTQPTNLAPSRNFARDFQALADGQRDGLHPRFGAHMADVIGKVV
jgi:hypothetical protein